jgi:hypothetical protein
MQMIDDSIPIAGLYRAYNNTIELLLSKQRSRAEMMTRINFISISRVSSPALESARHGEEMKILQPNVSLKQTTINKRQKGNSEGEFMFLK